MIQPDEARESSPRALRIGVSACLLGERVRYDGGHKREALLVESWSQRFTLVPVCPEIEIGLGSPRPAMHLETVKGSVRLRSTETGDDLTERMESYSARRIAELLDLSGFILKSKSPSCGVEGVPFSGGGTGRGIFAAALIAHCPDLPIVEEHRLRDRGVREEFLRRVLAHRGATGDRTVTSEPSADAGRDEDPTAPPRSPA